MVCLKKQYTGLRAHNDKQKLVSLNYKFKVTAESTDEFLVDFLKSLHVNGWAVLQHGELSSKIIFII